jgi:hypothetical protein
MTIKSRILRHAVFVPTIFYYPSSRSVDASNNLRVHDAAWLSDPYNSALEKKYILNHGMDWIEIMGHDNNADIVVLMVLTQSLDNQVLTLHISAAERLVKHQYLALSS